MLGVIFTLLVGLQVKHHLADYFLQADWMVAGKGDLRHAGGYAHAGLHALLSGAVMLVAGIPLLVLGLLALAEWAVHYALDFSKAHYARGTTAVANPQRYWAMHGFDQLGHQLTYAAMIFVAVASMGMV